MVPSARKRLARLRWGLLRRPRRLLISINFPSHWAFGPDPDAFDLHWRKGLPRARCELIFQGKQASRFAPKGAQPAFGSNDSTGNYAGNLVVVVNPGPINADGEAVAGCIAIKVGDPDGEV